MIWRWVTLVVLPLGSEAPPSRSLTADPGTSDEHRMTPSSVESEHLNALENVSCDAGCELPTSPLQSVSGLLSECR